MQLTGTQNLQKVGFSTMNSVAEEVISSALLSFPPIYYLFDASFTSCEIGAQTR